MLEYILDTNICIYIIKQKPPEVLDKFSTLKPGAVAMSLVTHAELLFGANRSKQSEQSHKILQELVTIIPSLTMEASVADHYADIRADLTSKGNLIGNNDLWIAAHARALDKILVSNNMKEFSGVNGLKLENWVAITTISSTT